VRVGRQTHPGYKRENNEDSIGVDEALGLFIIADGMGGHSLGEVASRRAVETIDAVVREAFSKIEEGRPNPGEDVTGVLSKAIERTNRRIYNYSQSLPGAKIMGTTVSLLLLRNRKAYIAHIGDSRIFRLRERSLVKLTKDHSRAQELVDMGVLDESRADAHKSSHILTKALGARESVVPDMITDDVQRGDSFLLASDGLFRVLNVAAVSQVLAGEGSPQQKCDLLLEKTLAGGAPDNVSVILVETDQ
jgi:serine/threonine protein phosphatase PrpC